VKENQRKVNRERGNEVGVKMEMSRKQKRERRKEVERKEISGDKKQIAVYCIKTTKENKPTHPIQGRHR
jgi:hypothetical protein